MILMTSVSTGEGSSPGSSVEGEGVCTGVMSVSAGKEVSVVWDGERVNCQKPVQHVSRAEIN